MTYPVRLALILADEKYLNQSAITQREPALNNPPDQALYVENDGVIDPPEATRLLLDRAEQMGARLQYQTEVTAIIRDNGLVTGVLTSMGRVDADVVILACGTGIPELAEMTGIRVPIVASPAILLRFSTAQPIVNAIIAGDDMEVRHAQNGDLLVAEDYQENGDVDAVSNAALLAIKSSLKASENSAMVHQSVGLRPTPADG